MDWEILESPGVEQVVQQAARKVASHYEVDAEDLAQEGRIMISDPALNLSECVPARLGILQYRLEQNLVDMVRTETRRRDKSDTYEGDVDEPSAQPLDLSGLAYTRALVESLLPGVWDSEFVLSNRAPTTPDPDMPRGWVNPTTGNVLVAHVADVRQAWARAGLTVKQKQALLLRYGVDMGWAEVGAHLGISRASAEERCIGGVGRMVEWLS